MFVFTPLYHLYRGPVINYGGGGGDYTTGKGGGVNVYLVYKIKGGGGGRKTFSHGEGGGGTNSCFKIGH